MFFRTAKSNKNRRRNSQERNVEFHVESLELREMLTGVGDDIQNDGETGNEPPPISGDGG